MAVCVLLTHLFSSLMPVNGCRYDYYNLSNSVITVDSVNPLMLACHELFKFHKRLKIANFYGPQTLSGIFCYSPEISNKLQPPADRVCTPYFQPWIITLLESLQQNTARQTQAAQKLS